MWMHDGKYSDLGQQEWAQISVVVIDDGGMRVEWLLFFSFVCLVVTWCSCTCLLVDCSGRVREGEGEEEEEDSRYKISKYALEAGYKTPAREILVAHLCCETLTTFWLALCPAGRTVGVGWRASQQSTPKWLPTEPGSPKTLGRSWAFWTKSGLLSSSTKNEEPSNLFS
ncbi:hypothetical protein Pcinc_007761 [Petrolisthes cinctipes]|uniref:Uncharacterized protein n=1 Tax=Petrolisthes cinctipes TaxID=88211 RepID=A0AAE1KX38_PETCI|nr:hypothetical protein Pcinc_007761 [Petrolisthes cinctipes]